MTNHDMSCFQCPPQLLHALDREARSFFWGTNSKVFDVSWSDICKPKPVGGLGLCPAKWFNLACLAKFGWKSLTVPNNLWVKIFTAKYLRQYGFLQAKRTFIASVAWTRVLQARSLLLKRHSLGYW